MEIIQVKKDKKKYLDLLLLADEQEDMVDRYLERGDMFVLTDGTVRAECVVTKEGPGIYELKNIATAPQFHRQGYGRRLIEYVFTYYPDLRTLCGNRGQPSLPGLLPCLRFYRFPPGGALLYRQLRPSHH